VTRQVSMHYQYLATDSRRSLSLIKNSESKSEAVILAVETDLIIILIFTLRQTHGPDDKGNGITQK